MLDSLVKQTLSTLDMKMMYWSIMNMKQLMTLLVATPLNIALQPNTLRCTRLPVKFKCNCIIQYTLRSFAYNIMSNFNMKF